MGTPLMMAACLEPGKPDAHRRIEQDVRRAQQRIRLRGGRNPVEADHGRDALSRGERLESPRSGPSPAITSLVGLSSSARQATASTARDVRASGERAEDQRPAATGAPLEVTDSTGIA
jgi:hypothetical protein